MLTIASWVVGRVNKWVKSSYNYMVLWERVPHSKQRYAFWPSKDKVYIVLKQIKQWDMGVWRWNLHWLLFTPDSESLKSWELELPQVSIQLVMVGSGEGMQGDSHYSCFPKCRLMGTTTSFFSLLVLWITWDIFFQWVSCINHQFIICLFC